MGLTFYPIEHIAVLQMFRQRLSKFMKAIQKTTTCESMSIYKRESIFDEVITAARSYNDEDQLSAQWYQYIRDTSNNTLREEHDKLIAGNFE